MDEECKATTNGNWWTLMYDETSVSRTIPLHSSKQKFVEQCLLLLFWQFSEDAWSMHAPHCLCPLHAKRMNEHESPRIQTSTRLPPTRIIGIQILCLSSTAHSTIDIITMIGMFLWWTELTPTFKLFTASTTQSKNSLRCLVFAIISLRMHW